jgi:hypothetical protein
MFLDVEGTGIKGPDVTEGVKAGPREDPLESLAKGKGEELDDKTGNENGGT